MSERRLRAQKMYEEGAKYKDISTGLNVPLNTLKSWKKRHKWQRVATVSKGVQPKKRGAPLNNKNAVGNRGGRGQPGNKNAVTTGEYESIFLEYMTDEEKDQFFDLETDPFYILSEEIRLLKIRQNRMLKRIAAAEEGLDEKEYMTLLELRGRKKIIESSKGKKVSVDVPEMVETEKRIKTTRKIDDVIRIEEALTRVSGQLSRAIKQLSELSMIESRAILMAEQTKYAKLQALKLKSDNNMELTSEEKKALGIVDASEPAEITIDGLTEEELDNEIAKLERELGAELNG